MAHDLVLHEWRLLRVLAKPSKGLIVRQNPDIGAHIPLQSGCMRRIWALTIIVVVRGPEVW